ncbi:MAG: class I SAM-dependent methyltransferase [Ignavibacteriae bacterium]|nr:class I SAM-dependent methyltransferase [Ignavibacteriota bacterium]
MKKSQKMNKPNISQKIPAYKRFFRCIIIFLFNTVFFPFRVKKSISFLNHIYEFDPLRPLHDKVKEVEIEEILPGVYRQNINLFDLESKYGSMTLQEIYTVAAIARNFNPKAIFEFGTFIGVTTLQMALNTDDDTKIYTLNLLSTGEDTKYDIGKTDEEKNLPDLQPGSRFKDSKVAGKITQLYGDSAVFDFSQFENKIDFVLVDASHEYEYVKNDTEKTFGMLKQGGTIVWHDYPNSPGVFNYLNELAGELTIYHIKDTHLAFSLNFNKEP